MHDIIYDVIYDSRVLSWYHIIINDISSSIVQCVPQVPRVLCTVLPTRRYPSCTSARLSPSIWQHHAAGWSAHALWLSQQPAPAALPLHLPCSKCAVVCPPHSVFHWLQQSPHYSTQLQGRPASWERLSRHLGSSSRLYEVNIWMWLYGRGSPLMVSITETERIRSKRISESRIRAGETRKWCSKAPAAAGAASGEGRPHWITGHDIISDIMFYIMLYAYMISLLSYVLIMISLSKSLTMLRWVDDVLVLE